MRRRSRISFRDAYLRMERSLSPLLRTLITLRWLAVWSVGYVAVVVGCRGRPDRGRCALRRLLARSLVARVGFAASIALTRRGDDHSASMSRAGMLLAWSGASPPRHFVFLRDRLCFAALRCAGLRVAALLRGLACPFFGQPLDVPWRGPRV